MKEIKLAPDKIADFLIENLKEPDTLFVFLTDTVMNSWIEYLVTHPEKSGIQVLPLERFMGWDTFKGNYLKGEQKGARAVPAILRKLFVQDLICKNADLPQSERFQSIIKPEDEFAQGATSFADWICKNLTSLNFWKKRLDQNKENYGELDAEDKDYEKLYQAYKDFLEANNLFEPSWLENLDLNEDNAKIILMYPELLEDYCDFADIFAASEKVTICTMPKDLPNPPAYFYPDSRTELRQTMLRIIQLVNEGKADWSEIALSIPNVETYRPYIEREFSVYGIPYVIKSGVSLTQNSAGRIFREINDCHKKNFTFDSVRSLVLDETLPWKEDLKEKREGLVRVGNEMRCICSPTQKDIWLSAFAKKLNHLESSKKVADERGNSESSAKYQEKIDYYSELKKFYQQLKSQVEGFFRENTFKSIEETWQEFKGIFFTDNFSAQANAILGRCLTELKEIINIEENYADCNLKIQNAYEFFLKEIDGKKYTPQQKDKSGVSIFAYKLSGPGYFKYQFVIDGSQKNLEIPYKRLTFLNSNKRQKLHLTEDDKKITASEGYIKLYAKKVPGGQGDDFVTFSAAENTFAKFAIPHNNLRILKIKGENDKDVNLTPNLDENDYVKQERKFILDPENQNAPEKFLPSQKEEFELWKKTQRENPNQKYKINDKIKNNLKKILIERRNSEDIFGNNICDEKIKITARGDLEKFFPCPRLWLLKSILKLRDDTLDTELMQSYDMGNLNHKILELFILQFKGKNLPFYDTESDSFKIAVKEDGVIGEKIEDYPLDLKPCVEKAIVSIPDFKDCPLVTESLFLQSEKIETEMIKFLKFLLKPYGSEKCKGGEKVAGFGKCKVFDCEKNLAARLENYKNSGEEKSGDEKFCGEKFDYFGKIDCLLLSPEDGESKNDWIIIDYKNSKVSMPSVKELAVDKNGILKDFQMPLYFNLVGQENKHEIAAGYFYAIKDRENRKVVDKFSVSKEKNEDGKTISDGDYVQDSLYENFLPTMAALNSYAQVFYQITDPKNSSLDFTPHTSKSERDKLNVKSYENCQKCQLKGICRTTFTVGGKSLASADTKTAETKIGEN